MVSTEEFIKVWNEEENVQSVADAVESTYYAVAQTASRLRKQGYNLPKKTPPKEHFERIGAIGGRRSKND
jgi:hypothetical protein